MVPDRERSDQGDRGALRPDPLSDDGAVALPAVEREKQSPSQALKEELSWHASSRPLRSQLLPSHRWRSRKPPERKVRATTPPSARTTWHFNRQGARARWPGSSTASAS